MLTAYGEVENKVTAFNDGADDYLVKTIIIRKKSEKHLF